MSVYSRKRSPIDLGAFAGTGRERAIWWMMLALLVLCLIGGGSNRPDTLSLLYLRPATILLATAMIAIAPRVSAGAFRWLVVLLAALAATMLLQLVPLPPELWSALPGHAPLMNATAAAGLPAPWRPISVTPALTMNSLVSLTVPAAVLIGFIRLRHDQRVALVVTVIAMVLDSAVLAVLQVSGDPLGPLYTYRLTLNGAAVGFFANRNHQALLLAMTFPMLRVWTELRTSADSAGVRRGVAGAIAVFLAVLIVVTGSRAGALLALVGLVAAYLVAPVGDLLPRASKTVNRAVKIAVPVAILVGVALTAVLAGRAVVYQRLMTGEAASDMRVTFLPQMLGILKTYAPFGSGYGSFDATFRIAELDSMLRPNYFNHAHDDFLELLMTGGVAGGLVLIAFLIWFARRGIEAFARSSAAQPVRRLGVIMIVMIAIASLVDYPLRTPLMMAIATIACCWAAMPIETSNRGSRRRRRHGSDIASYSASS